MKHSSKPARLPEWVSSKWSSSEQVHRLSGFHRGWSHLWLLFSLNIRRALSISIYTRKQHQCWLLKQGTAQSSKDAKPHPPVGSSLFYPLNFCDFSPEMEYSFFISNVSITSLLGLLMVLETRSMIFMKISTPSLSVQPIHLFCRFCIQNISTKLPARGFSTSAPM